MALAYVLRERFNLGSVQGLLCKITGDTSYPAGGYDVNADRPKLGFALLYAVIPLGGNGEVFRWDRANKKLLIYEANYANTIDGPLTERDAAENVSAVETEALILGA